LEGKNKRKAMEALSRLVMTACLAWPFLLIQLKLLQRIRKGAKQKRESGDSGIRGL